MANVQQLGMAYIHAVDQKSSIIFFVVFGALLVIQNLDYGENEKILFSGLCIGELGIRPFVLAAQGTTQNFSVRSLWRPTTYYRLRRED